MTNNDWAWMDSANEIDQSTVETTGPAYPFIQWVNGQSALKPLANVAYTGGWFAPGDRFDEALMKGWTKGELAHRGANDNPTEGFFLRDISVAVIRYRRCWIVNVGERNQFFPWNAYDAATNAGVPKGKLNVLCLVKGMEDAGAIVLTMKGAISAAFTGKGGVLATFKAAVVDEADKLNRGRGVKNKFPLRAFWLTAGPKRDDKGAPTFEMAGKGTTQSPVTYPIALGLVAKPAPGDLAKRFVGPDLLKQLNALWEDSAAWASAWDTAQAEAPAEGTDEPPFNGDVPPAGEDEMPF